MMMTVLRIKNIVYSGIAIVLTLIILFNSTTIIISERDYRGYFILRDVSIQKVYDGVHQESRTSNWSLSKAESDHNAKTKESHLPLKTSNRSYVVSVYVWEQLMASSLNLLQLQCLMRVTPMISVVEHQLRKNRSNLGFEFNDHTLPVLSDVFNMDTWYTQWPKHGPPLAPLTSRKEFFTEIENFHKSVVLVQLSYKRTSGNYCLFNWNISSLLKDLEQYPLLSVSRNVCISIGDKMPAAHFKKLVFGDTGVDNKVIIFQQWRGVGGGRANIISGCDIIYEHYSQLKPSTTVIEDAKIFADTNLGGFNNYLSVSARFEKFSQKYRKLSLENGRDAVSDGIRDSMAMITRLKNKTGLERVYLAYDFGLYGSRTFQHHSYYNASDLLIKFQEDLYEGKVSHVDYVKSLQRFKFTSPGYVAMVQMTLSSRGKCLFQFGVGHCIDFVNSLFIHYHRRNKICYDHIQHSF